jgi:copper resistance protein B
MRIAALLALVPGVSSLAALAQDPHAGHQHGGQAAPVSRDDEAARTALDLPVGNAPRPKAIEDTIADRVYGTAAMERARDILNDEHGGGLVSKVMSNMLEGTASGDTGYRWDLEAWYGGDLHRVVIKTEGEGARGEVESAEVQALYSRAAGRYTDVQAGVRYDVEPDGLAYATVGVESLLPYWFDVEGALFLSERGDAFARLEGSYDLQLTQRLILQPRVELMFAAQDVAVADIGSGFSSAELGLRLRYELRRELAPYIGVNFETSLGRTADRVRASGGDIHDTTVVAGVRAWF